MPLLQGRQEDRCSGQQLRLLGTVKTEKIKPAGFGKGLPVSVIAEKSDKNEKYALTKSMRWCKMEVHTVGVCVFLDSSSSTNILAQNMAAVKTENTSIWQLNHAYQASNTSFRVLPERKA
jgi:hypothetical protein